VIFLLAEGDHVLGLGAVNDFFDLVADALHRMVDPGFIFLHVVVGRPDAFDGMTEGAASSRIGILIHRNVRSGRAEYVLAECGSHFYSHYGPPLDGSGETLGVALSAVFLEPLRLWAQQRTAFTTENVGLR
jgi:hypothetical protein